MILLNAHQIAKSYAGRTLFENVSLGIETNERIGLVGPNGAGKSTLLRILSRQIEPDHGNVTQKKGLKLGFLEQTPEFNEDATIISALLEKCPDQSSEHGRAYELMGVMGLNQFEESKPVSELSGGWKKRLALARELMLEPDLLFLDEPTNHLDLDGILWLESYLTQAKTSLLMITHDRLFLKRVATKIWDLDPRNPNYLLATQGNYTDYLKAKELELAAQARHEWVVKNRLRRETEWLSRGSIARQTKQSARIEAAHELKETAAALRAKNTQNVTDIEFGSQDRSPTKLIEAKKISKHFGEHTLFKDLDLLITNKTRLGLLGNNGCGKSTLIRVLLGQMAPDQGQVRLSEGLQVAYFEQNRETLDFKKSVLKNLCPEGEYVFFQDQPLHIRSYLDRFHFGGVKAEMPVAKLSGGEQARLRLAQLMLTRANVLVLDEPTNDLDTETLDQLEDSLKEFNGAVILVTHDRYFLDAVSNQILAFPELKTYASYFQWESARTESPEPEARATPREVRSTTGKTRMSYKDKFELENMEATITQLELDLEQLTRESERHDLLRDHQRMHSVHERMARLQNEIDAKYTRWAELEKLSKG